MQGLRTKFRSFGMGALSLFALGASAPVAAEWIIPEEERQVANPVERTAESVEIGRELYEQNCETCHGPAGTGDGPGARVLEARMPNLQDTEWAAEKTDGEWFYKIAVGKDPMVGYEDFLEEEEMWHVVNYVRSLSLAGAHSGPSAGDSFVVAQAESAGPGTEETSTEPPAGESDEAHAGDEDPTTEAAAPEVAEEAPAEGHNAQTHGEAHAEQHAGDPADEHADEDHSTTAAHGGHDDHGDAGHSPPPADFNPKAISNYEAGYAKGPLVWALVLPILIGGVFVLFQKMVPPPPAEEAPAHGDDHGH